MAVNGPGFDLILLARPNLYGGPNRSGIKAPVVNDAHLRQALIISNR